MNFKVYVIHSSQPLGDLKSLLQECGGFVYAGIIYKSLRKQTPHGSVTEKEETRKTIVFCPSTTIKQLETLHPHYKSRIADYNWDSFPVPNTEQGEVWDLHISGVPNDYTVKEASAFVVNSLSCILPEKEGDRQNYTVDFAPRLRETGEIFGFGHIIFDKSVDRETIKLCKLILHNTPVNFKSRAAGGPERRMVTCVWHRPPTQAKEGEKEVFRKFTPKSREGVRRGRPSTMQVDVSGVTPLPSRGETWAASAVQDTLSPSTKM